MLLGKGIYPYEYLDRWKRFDETLFPDIEDFYSNLKMKGVIYADYRHPKKVWKYFKIKNLGEYDDLYVQIYTLLLLDVFGSFRNKCIEIYQFDPAFFYRHLD